MEKKTAILVVEDEQILREMYAEALQVKGFCVFVASDGVEAIEQIKNNHEKIDLILLDLLMPNKDGFEVLAEINENPEWKNIPVIVATNLDEESDKKRAFALGANEYYVKAAKTPQELALDIASICCSKKGKQRKKVKIDNC